MEGRKDTKNLSRFPGVLLRLIARLPLPFLHTVGTVLGWAIYGISPAYRRNLQRNMLQAGYADARTRREAIASAGKMLTELPAIWFRPHDEVASLVREVIGGDEALAERARGKPLLFLTPHMGCFEITAQYAALRMPITVLYRPPKLGWLEPLMLEGRVRTNVRLAPADVSGVRELFKALQRGEAVGFLPDQVPGKGEGEWADFFGRPAYTMTLAARLAEREGVACFLAYGRRLEHGRGYSIVLRPLPEKLEGETATRHLNRALEELVRDCPAQYLWSYNRYKVPAGAPPPP
ncbi:MAG: lysophospholipid acyltransferase family protein [Betaproteobacteria bacterium]|nr:MAG: lysophospholipid acyltransferase family protein [Betaproteobacteria bacterium]